MTFYSHTFSACLVFAALATQPAHSQPALNAPAPVLMISIDGLRPDAVIKAEAHGLRVPNLRRFITEGTYADGVVGVVPTLTYPSHTTLVTGVNPDTHGLTMGWRKYPDRRVRLDAHTFAIAMLREHHPGLFTIHLSSLDEEEHLSSPFSAESNRTLEAIDGMIGQLRDAALVENPAAVMIVVSDDGFAQTDFHTNLFGPLLRAGLITAGGPGTLGVPTFKSWKATLWPAGGSAAIMLHEPNDTATREAILKLLGELAADPANGIDRIMTGEEFA